MEWDLEYSFLEEDVLSNYLNYQDMQSKHSKESIEDLIPINDEEKRSKRLVKNRESARNSRKRKKVYLKHLEERITELTEEVAALTQELETTHLFPPPEHKYKGVFYSCSIHLVESLREARQKQSSDEELKAMIKLLDSRRGATGFERQGFIEYLLNSLMDNCLPIQLKNLVTSIKPERNGFSSECPWNDLFSTLDLTPEKTKKILQLRQEFLEKKLLYSHTFNDVQKVRKILLRRSNCINESLGKCLKNLAPTSLCDMIIRFSDQTFNKKVTNVEEEMHTHNSEFS